MWFAKNPLKIDIKINIPIEIFEIILLYFIFVIQNNFSGKYKNKIISNISIEILIFISIFNGF